MASDDEFGEDYTVLLDKADTKGSQYECLIPTLFALELCSNEDVSNFKLSCNNKKYGKFDDVLCEIKYKGCDYYETYALQLKHEQKESKIYEVKDLNSSKFNFNIYFEYFISDIGCRSSLEKLNLIFFTNRKFSLCNENGGATDKRIYKHTKSGKSIEIYQQKEMRKFYKKSEVMDGKVFNYRLVNDYNNDDYNTFFACFSTYTNQKSVTELINEIKLYFKASYGNEKVAQDFINFFIDYNEDCKENKETLTKKFIHIKTADTLFTDNNIEGFEDNEETNEQEEDDEEDEEEEEEKEYGKEDEVEEKEDDRIVLLKKAVLRFDVTLIEDPKLIETALRLFKIEKICENFERINKYAKRYGLIQEDLKNVNWFKRLDSKKKSRIYWLLNILPLVITCDSASKVQVLEAIKLCRQVDMNKKFILISDCVSRSDLNIEDIKVLSNLCDLGTECSDIYNAMLRSFCCNLQGRQNVFLRDFVDSEDVARTIQISDLLRMLEFEPYTIGSKLHQLPQPYIKRSLCKVKISLDAAKHLNSEDILVINPCNSSTSALKIHNIHPTKFKRHVRKEYRENCLILTNSKFSDEGFEEVCSYNRHRNVHLLEASRREKFKWVRSQGSADVISKFLIDEDLVSFDIMQTLKETNDIFIIITNRFFNEERRRKGVKGTSIENYLEQLSVVHRDCLKLIVHSNNFLQEFEKVCLMNAYKNVHLLNLLENEFQYVRSQGSIDNLRKCIKRNNEEQTAINNIERITKDTIANLKRCNDIVLVISDEEISFVKQYLKTKAIIIKKYIKKPIKYKGLVLVTNTTDSEKHFNDVCSMERKKNIHLLKLSQNELEWIRTRYCTVNATNVVLESEFGSHFLNKINIISAESGMGKTVLMNALKRNCPQNLWPVLITLREHYEFFTEEKEVDDILDYVLEKTIEASSAKESAVKLQNIFKRRNAILFLWDGIDELPISCVNNVIDSIKKLKNFHHWIAGRNHHQEHLENSFSTFSLSISELSDDDKNKYLEDPTLIERLKSAKQYEILTTPLQIGMLREICQNSDNYEKILSQNMTLTHIYKHLVEGRFSFRREKENADNSNFSSVKAHIDLKKSKLLTYKKIAVMSTLRCKDVFPQLINDECKETLDSIRKEGDSFGFITSVDYYNTPQFFHRTCAEYLTASYLVDNLEKPEGKKFILLLFDEENGPIRRMFDTILAEEADEYCEAQVLYLSRNFYGLEGLLESKANDLLRKDRGGRSILHIASSWGPRHRPLQPYGDLILVEKTSMDRDRSKYTRFIEHLVSTMSLDFEEKDQLLSWSPINYAVASWSLCAVEVFCARKSLSISQFYDPKEIDTVVSSCLKFDYSHLFESLDTAPNILGLSYSNIHVYVRFPNDALNQRVRLKMEVDEASRLLCPNFKKDLYEIVFVAAVRLGYLTLVKLLIKENVHPSLVFRRTGSFLHTGLRTKHTHDVVKDVLNGSVKIDDCQIDLVYSGRSKINKVMCKAVSHLINKKSDQMNRNLNAIKYVVSMSLPSLVDVNFIDKNDNTPLHQVLSDNLQSLEMVTLLMRGFSNFNSVNTKGQNILHLACIANDTYITKFLISEATGFIDVNATDNKGYTPLRYLVNSGVRDLNLIKLLIDEETQINVNWSNSAYFKLILRLLELIPKRHIHDQMMPVAQRFNNSEEVRHFLNSSSEYITKRDEEGRTVLQVAAYFGSYHHVKILAETRNFDLNLADNHGNTAFHLSLKSRYGNLEKIKCLIDAGADVSVLLQGMNLLHLAIKEGCFDCACYFIGKHLFNIDEPDAGGNFPVVIFNQSTVFSRLCSEEQLKEIRMALKFQT